MLRAAPFVFAVALLTLPACRDASESPTDGLTTAEAVADRALDRFEANVGRVDGFTAVADGAEARYTITDDTTGIETFQVELVPPDAPSAPLLAILVPNVRLLAKGLRRADFGGLVTRDGRRAYVLSTDNPAAVLGGAGPSAPASPGQEFRTYVDAETFDVIELFQSFTTDSLSAPLTQRFIYSDFQTVDGLALPRHVRVIRTGLEALIPLEERMVQEGELGMQRQALSQRPASPERDARLAQIDAELRRLHDGVDEVNLDVEAVRVGQPAGSE